MPHRLVRALDAQPERHLWLASFSLAFCFVFARDPLALLLPRMAFEDGSILFQHYYGGITLDTLLIRYGGYVSLLPDLAGLAASAVPTRSIPFALALFPMLVAAAVPAETSRVLGLYGVPRPARITFALVLIAMPLGSSPLFSNTIYAYCHLLYLALLWSLAHARRGAATEWSWWVLGPACLASHPLSAVCLPVYALAFARAPGRGSAARLAVATVTIAVYGAFGIDAPARALPGVEFIAPALDTFSGRVLAELLIGGGLRAALWSSAASPLLHLLGAGLGVALVVALARRRSRGDADESTAIGCALFYAVALTALTVIARWGEPGAELGAFLHGRRYLHVQQLMTALACFWLAWPALASWRRPRALTAGLAAWLLLLNATSGAYFDWPAAQGRAVREFVSRVHEAERAARLDPTYLQRLQLPRGEWTIEIEVRGSALRHGAGGADGAAAS